MREPVLDRRTLAAAGVGCLLAWPSSGATGALLPAQDSIQEGGSVNGTDPHKRVVQDLIEVVWREGRVERLGEFWTDDCVNHAAPAGEDRGLAALRAYHEGFAPFFSGLSDIRIEVQQQVAEADRVVTQMLLTARHTGTFSGAPPTGRTVSLATIRIDRLRDGKIAEHWSVADLAGLMQQLKG